MSDIHTQGDALGWNIMPRCGRRQKITAATGLPVSERPADTECASGSLPANGELDGVLLLKQKNLPRPLLAKEGSINAQPRSVMATLAFENAL